MNTMNSTNMNQLSDLFTTFLLNNNKQNLMEELMEKFSTIFIRCTKEGDASQSRKFWNSGISYSNVKGDASSEDLSRGDSKKYSVNTKCFHLTYDNNQDISLDDFMTQIFKIFDGKIKKWAVAHDVAPTTGMIHYHLYLEQFDAWKVLDARKKFTVIDSKQVEIIPNIKTGGGTKMNKQHIIYNDIKFNLNIIL